jgi:pyridoxal 5'-phosphate synthase pdxS subunit
MYLDDTFRVKIGLAEMLKGGVIMDVTNAEQALIAEKAGATSARRHSQRRGRGAHGAH